MSYNITLVPENQTFLAQAKQTVLDAALNNNIAFPHRCLVGACASCLCKVISGEVSYQLDPMLTDKEQQQGWMFACLAYPESDLEISFSEE
ncbi:2Fe-2S iron-sulfur cluster-binding protein [Vibrio hippocampi]|uniref:Ferredoxin n=1 Tax=Vibrio hippocampi TaxID=654686 RepID=A0ABM8ZFP8_9VIBR|nr:2Fe-2S iron-sulfur cluster-binding protein [Vibrio hippocampi]CAH0524212.1 Ferredoxin [Vibrio hippocampi]